MKRLLGLLVMMVVAVPVAATAHGPTRLKLIETVDINAPADAVWAKIKDFGNMQAWHPAVAEDKAEGGNAPGATRTLVLKGGGEIKEKLEKYNEAEKSYFYRITEVDPKVLPVTNYASWITVKDNGSGGSTVEWKGGFYRGDPGNVPPPELNDDAAKKAVQGVYRSGLDNLKKIVEGGK
ncbi:MAG: SRPBCC family protein [Alphaproteobacteria bacterium]